MERIWPQLKPSEILGRAIDIMQEKGHHKGAWENDTTGAVCLYGAVNKAALGHAKPWDSRQMERLANLYGKIEPALYAVAFDSGALPINLVAWNDKPDISGEDVILAMKKAVEYLRERDL